MEFKPKPGQIDFTKARWAPVVNCVIKYKDKILLVQRSSEIDFYPECWTSISGFLDDHKDIEEKAAEEIEEELGIGPQEIISIKRGEVFDRDDSSYGKTWIVHPVLVEISTDQIKLDWEAKDYKWIDPFEIKNFNLIPGFEEMLEKLGLLPKNHQ